MRSSKDNQRRVQVIEEGSRKVYSVSAWPGFDDVIGACLNVIVLLVILGIIIGFVQWMGQVENAIVSFIKSHWLKILLSWIVINGGMILFSYKFGISVPMILIGGMYRLIEIPYELVYRLSPKSFWMTDKKLYHRCQLGGFIKRERQIPFDQILRIEIDHPGNSYHLTVYYEANYPKWMSVMLVFWNERLTQSKLMLVNGIRSIPEATEIQRVLLDTMTGHEAVM